jgi:SAM-dependent methyltransferase
MTELDTSLAEPSHWEARGANIATGVRIERHCWFREQSRRIAPVLSAQGQRSVVELGAYPGHILDWACRVSGLAGTAVEYVPAQARALEATFPSFEILQGDFLSETAIPPGRSWDVVMSFGLVEHWTDLQVPVRRHLELVAPGGHCVIGMPLHDGPYGRVLGWLDPALLAKHGRYSVGDLRRAFEAVATPGWHLEFCGAVEGAGFWNCGVTERVAKLPAWLQGIANKSLGAWHRSVTRLPAPPLLRPNALLIARKSK